MRLSCLTLLCTAGYLATAAPPTYVITDTGQERCYGAQAEIAYPKAGETYHGQDAQYQGAAPAFRKNGDGTVSDLNTGLMWLQDPGPKRTYDELAAGAARCRTGGHADWRLPTIKELYSLMDFRGTDPDPQSATTADCTPFIDTAFFAFSYGRASDGDRIIDAQYATATRYTGRVMDGAEAMFGVNFADGRIKGYPTAARPGRGAKKFYALYVRGQPAYGQNRFRGNGDGTVTDEATGLVWQQADSGHGVTWKDALAYAEVLVLGGKSDWRLPDAKELQSLVDYSRSPDATRSAAVAPLFTCTPITNEAGQADFACYWTGTTHAGAGGRGETAAYVAFGRAMGYMRGRWMDVHGAGCQRSDPKAGNPADAPQGRGPQGDAVRIHNFVRCVRGGAAKPRASGPAVQPSAAARREVLHRPSFVSRLDRDGDGKVSRQEFDGPAAPFDRLDRDGDGFLSEAEAPPPPSGRTR